MKLLLLLIHKACRIFDICVRPFWNVILNTYKLVVCILSMCVVNRECIKVIICSFTNIFSNKKGLPN